MNGLLILSLWCTATSPATDPFLAESVRESVVLASQAELDPHRGPGNALEILKMARSHSDPASAAALNLRIAATTLRERFLSSSEFAFAIRPVQALSTFSRLDLTEPGLLTWIDRALQANPDARKKLGPVKTWRIQSALLVRGAGLDRTQVSDAFTTAFRSAGLRLDMVPVGHASTRLIVSAENTSATHAGTRAIRITLHLESLERGKVVWESSLFREEEGTDFERTRARTLTWVSRVGGRDLLFHWLGEHAFKPLNHHPQPATLR